MKKQQAPAPLCPMRGARCVAECAWNTSGGCAMKVLAGEMYCVAEIMSGGQVLPASAGSDTESKAAGEA